MTVWGGDLRRQRDRRFTRWDSPAAVVAAVVWLVILLWLGPRALDIEHQNETRARDAHIAATDRP